MMHLLMHIVMGDDTPYQHFLQHLRFVLSACAYSMLHCSLAALHCPMRLNQAILDRATCGQWGTM